MNDELIYDWLYAIIGSTSIIKADQNGPKLSGSFLIWSRVSSVPVEYSSAEGVSDDYDVDWTHELRCRDTISVEAWGPNAWVWINKIRIADKIVAARQILSAASTTFLHVTSVRDLTQILDTKYSPALQADLEFLTNYYTEYTETNVVVDETTLTGTVIDDNDVEHVTTITIEE
jgi:hypothetical protein